jgi:hypothetical protein
MQLFVQGLEHDPHAAVADDLRDGVVAQPAEQTQPVRGGEKRQRQLRVVVFPGLLQAAEGSLGRLDPDVPRHREQRLAPAGHGLKGSLANRTDIQVRDHLLLFVFAERAFEMLLQACQFHTGRIW